MAVLGCNSSNNQVRQSGKLQSKEIDLFSVRCVINKAPIEQWPSGAVVTVLCLTLQDDISIKCQFSSKRPGLLL